MSIRYYVYAVYDHRQQPVFIGKGQDYGEKISPSRALVRIRQRVRWVQNVRMQKLLQDYARLGTQIDLRIIFACKEECDAILIRSVLVHILSYRGVDLFNGDPMAPKPQGFLRRPNIAKWR